jgi:rSAM/selenodomain-associated transferase 1
MNPALLIFIKNSIPGKVKTRLAKDVGDAEALRIYQQLLAHTQTITQAFPYATFLWYSDFIPTEDDWSPAHYTKKVQAGGDLGQRMSHAFTEAFESGYQPVIIIGSDCPTLTSGLLLSTLEKLQNHDFVIGPATDGGYYLLAMRTFVPTVFENKSWSTDAVLESTLRDIAQANQTVCQLPALSDIDTLDDWEQFKASSAGCNFE